jgi:hypothetical protein
MKIKLIIILALILTSCSKDCPIDQPTRTELLTSNEWIGVSYKEYVNNVKDSSDDMSNYNRFFLANGDCLTYKNDTPDNIVQWKFVNNQQAIDLIEGDDITTFQIETLNEISLVLYYEMAQGTDTIKIEISYKR